ncbi:MAG: hypothetical protein ACRD12_11660 [Acidimicrobiales bacterium]
MPRILDTLSGFEVFARKAGLENPMTREVLWKDVYENAYPEVFEGFYAAVPDPQPPTGVVRELSRVRERVEEGAPVVRQAITDAEKAMPAVLGRPAEPSPRHVLMVGTLTTNAAVGRIGDDVAVFHCLEWFQSPEGAQVLAAHETTHGWHEIALGAKPPADAAWTAFSEGLAIAASRQLMPGRPDLEYYWFGHGEVDTWLEFCQERYGDLVEHFRASLDASETVETYFGSGLIQGQWRVGFYLADKLVASLGRPLPELVTLSVDEGRQAIRDALANA